MRNFIVTVNGKNYQVGVEEVGVGSAPAPVVTTVQAAEPEMSPAPERRAEPARAPQRRMNTEELTIEQAPVAAPVAAPAAAPVAPAAKAVAPVGNGEKVISPFPGLIKNLLVAEGATVKKDQPILVLEAMKMDNDITAPCDGVVSFCVAKGSNVESDAVLAVIG